MSAPGKHLHPKARIVFMTASTSNPPDTETVDSPTPESETPNWLNSLLHSAFARVPALVLLLSIGFHYEARNQTAFGDYDIWFHLSTGNWILEHHALPHNGLYTQYSARPWMAYSWGFELIAATLYKMLGLRALPVLLMVLNLALGVIFFRLALGRNSLGDSRSGSPQYFWAAVLLSA